MAKTLLRVRQGGVAFYLTEASKGANSGRLYRLNRTSDYGKTKDGWVRVGAAAAGELAAIQGEAEQFAACMMAFASKPPKRHIQNNAIRGLAGKWEGEAFPERKSRSEEVSRHG